MRPSRKTALHQVGLFLVASRALTGIRQTGEIPDDELESAVGGGVGLDELRLQDDDVHEDVAGGDEGVARRGGLEPGVVHGVGRLRRVLLRRRVGAPRLL